MTRNIIQPASDIFSDFMHDESRTVGFAESISFPRSEEDVIDVVKTMAGQGVSVTVQGARTGLAAGAVPFGGHILNLSRMDRILGAYKAENGHYVFRLQPGVVLSSFRKMVVDRNYNTAGWDEASLSIWEDFCHDKPQFFPPDPTETTAAIGGMVACNASGARTYYYGPMRDYVRGLRVVLPDGDTLALRRGQVVAVGRRIELITANGRKIDLELPLYKMPAAKNAAGYYIKDDMDAVDIFIGSDGTLGVITEVEAELLLLPEEITSCCCFFHKEEDAELFVHNAKGQIDSAVAWEYFDHNALTILRRQKEQNNAFSQLPALDSAYQAAIYCEFHCSCAENAHTALLTLGSLVTQYGGREEDVWVATTEKSREQLIYLRHAIPESVNMLIDRRRMEHPTLTKIGTDMSVPDAALLDAMAMYRGDLQTAGLEYAVWGHIGDNHLHVNILPRDENDARLGKEIYKKWAAQISAWGGSVAAEHGIGKIKAPFLAIMYGPAVIEQMRDLKHRFDPANILGTGNLFNSEQEVRA